MTAVLRTDVLPLLHAANLQSSFAIMTNNIRLSERSICAQISKLLLTAIDEPVRKTMCKKRNRRTGSVENSLKCYVMSRCYVPTDYEEDAG